jgi:hypothetical protein
MLDIIFYRERSDLLGWNIVKSLYCFLVRPHMTRSVLFVFSRGQVVCAFFEGTARFYGCFMLYVLGVWRGCAMS